MKSAHPLLILLLVAVISACGRQGDNPTLVRLDSLVLAAPDSALHLLQSLPDDSLPTEDDRAYHAVLLAEAAYKAYIPATADSAILAAERHYAGRDRAKHLRALICCGTTAEELGHPEEAMRHYKQAETLARDLRDTFRTGYILFRQAELYHQQGVPHRSITERYQSALQLFELCDNKYYEASCLCEIGSIYRILEPDSAMIYLRRSATLSREIGRMSMYYSALTRMADYELFYGKHPAAALQIVREVLDSCHVPLEYNRYYYTAAEAYLVLGMVDSARMTMERCPYNMDYIDTLSYHRMLAKIDSLSGRWTSYVRHRKLADSINRAHLKSSTMVNLLGKENSYEQDQLSSEKHRLQSNNTMTWTLVFAMLLLFVIGTAMYVHHLRQERFRSATIAASLESLRQDLEQSRRESATMTERLNIAQTHNDAMLTELVGRQNALSQETADKPRALGQQIDQLQALSRQIVHHQEACDLRISLVGHLSQTLAEYALRRASSRNKTISLNIPVGLWSEVRAYVDKAYEGYFSHYELTDHNLHIIGLVSIGLSANEIALLLDYTNPRSVYSHIHRIQTAIGTDRPLKELLDEFDRLPEIPDMEDFGRLNTKQ